MNNAIIINQIIILAILVAIGILATKLKVITEGTKKGIADIVFDITLPLLIITTFAKIDMNPDILRNSGLVFLFAYVALAIMYLAGDLSSLIMGLKGNQRAVMINHHMFGNIVFLGFPLMDSLFPGGEGLLYAAVFHLASNSVMWTFGVWVFLKGKGGKRNEVWKNMLNPNTIAFFLGLIIMFFNLKLPDLLFEPLHGLGRATIYLSMLYIGAMLVQTHVRGILKKPHVFVLSFNKLLLVPFVLSMVINLSTYLFFPEFGDIAKKVVLLEAAMPCMATIVVMAHKFGSDDKLATENVFMSTVFSIFTIPLVYWGLSMMDKLFAGIFG
ncbi:MAG: AEC family transporter [Bacteroidales bacterium]|nr:AEC family transporter [Bacteroidales bacterium]